MMISAPRPVKLPAGTMTYVPSMAKAVMGGMIATNFLNKFGSNTNMAVRSGRSVIRKTMKKKTPYKKNTVKAQMLRQIDNHHMTVSDNTNAVAGTQGTIYTHNLTADIVQGTTNATRIGDKIHLVEVKLNGRYTTAVTAGAYMARVMLLWSGEEVNPTGLASGLGFGELFLPNTGADNVCQGIINPKAVTIVDDFTIDINSQITAVSDIVSFTRNIKLDLTHLYQATGSVYGKTRSLYLVVVGFVNGGTPATTPIGTIAIASDVVFKPL